MPSPTPKKDCLKEIVRNFLTELDKLDYIDRVTTQRNFDGSAFLNNADVTRIRARKAVVDELFLPTVEQILDLKSPDPSRGTEMLFRVGTKTDAKIAQLNEMIDAMDEEKAGKILTDFLKRTEPIVNAQDVERDKYQDRSAGMTQDQKKSALKEHSFSDNWVFNFLAKLVKTVRETLGIKTSSEKLLDESREAASELTTKSSPSVS
ncbi:hypothetical protein [Legionella nagasakiensis]|uniref:hypothetical protein n=1 Tax=Legionella nagasakiensis TaxID=535290 RepID=UPI001055F24F|nr:hypothetical protein [Legionella nagasakiensis]